MSILLSLAFVCFISVASPSEATPNEECSQEDAECSLVQPGEAHGAMALMQLQTVKSTGRVSKGASDHHDTFEEACRTCQEAAPDETCSAAECGDGSGKFCWTTGADHDGFKECPPDSKMLLSIDRGHTVSHKDSHSVSGEKKNVLGTSLQSCSVKGTALTGFSRNGKCEDEGDDDSGSHHICIKMKADFCSVTGQPNWCEEEAPCMDQEGDCKIDHWCVCQWAFAKYLAEAGGCDKIVDLVCEATNMAAFKAYEESDDPSHQSALACIKSKCSVN